MKAAVVTHDHKVSVEDKEVRDLKPGEALVQTEYCGVCHTDLHVKNADFGDVTGVTLGHEGIGRVIKVGEGVESLKEGIAFRLLGCSKVVDIVNTVRQVVKHYAVMLRTQGIQ